MRKDTTNLKRHEKVNDNVKETCKKILQYLRDIQKEMTILE